MTIGNHFPISISVLSQKFYLVLVDLRIFLRNSWRHYYCLTYLDTCLLVGFIYGRKFICFILVHPFQIIRVHPCGKLHASGGPYKTPFTLSVPPACIRMRLSLESGGVRPLDGCHIEGTKDTAHPKDVHCRLH